MPDQTRINMLLADGREWLNSKWIGLPVEARLDRWLTAPPLEQALWVTTYGGDGNGPGMHNEAIEFLSAARAPLSHLDAEPDWRWKALATYGADDRVVLLAREWECLSSGGSFDQQTKLCTPAGGTPPTTPPPEPPPSTPPAQGALEAKLDYVIATLHVIESQLEIMDTEDAARAAQRQSFERWVAAALHQIGENTRPRPDLPPVPDGMTAALWYERLLGALPVELKNVEWIATALTPGGALGRHLTALAERAVRAYRAIIYGKRR